MNLDLCLLHRGLYSLADKALQIPFDPDHIRKKLNLGQEIDLLEMINNLEEAGHLTFEGSPLTIRLKPWPKTCSSKAEATDRFLNPPLIMPKESKKTETNKRNTEIYHEAGLRTFAQPADFKHFLAAWGPVRKKIAIDRAFNQWKLMEKAKTLPDISVIITALRLNPPTARTWPGSWLKKQPWKTKRQSVHCKVCFDEKIVYGVDTYGNKGPIPCPICQKI